MDEAELVLFFFLSANALTRRTLQGSKFMSFCATDLLENYVPFVNVRDGGLERASAHARSDVVQ